MKVTRYIIQSSRYTFEVIVQKTSDRYIIQLGGQKKSCVYILIYRQADDDDQSEAQLEGISYYEKCSLKGDLKAGTGTVIMLKTALAFTTQLFPHIKSLRLKDNSTITCMNKKKISLACTHFVKYGKTWYQDKYNALTLFPDDQKKMDKAFSYIRAPGSKGDFNRFWKKYIFPHLEQMKIKNKQRFQEQLQEVWDGEGINTLQDFFIDLLEKDCMFLMIWLQDYLRRRHNVISYGAEFVIRGDVQDKVEIIKKEKVAKVVSEQNGGEGNMDLGDAKAYL